MKLKEKKNFSIQDFQKLLYAFYTCIKHKYYDIEKYKEELKIINEVKKEISYSIADDDQLSCEHFEELNLYFLKMVNNLALSNDDKMSFKDSFLIKEFEKLEI